MDNLRAQIYNNMNSKETEELLDIWQNGDTTEWDPKVFEILKEIFMGRLGYVPPPSNQKQATQILEKVNEYLKKGKFTQALTECEIALQLAPDFAQVYYYFGEVYAEMEQFESSIINYQKAIQIEPEFKVAWENMLIVEEILEEEFLNSQSVSHLDRALDYAIEDDIENGLIECEQAKLNLPSIAFAHNLLGMALEELAQIEPAIDSYLKAIELNPRFYDARTNLANARIRLEKEQYKLILDGDLNFQELENSNINIEFEDSNASDLIGNENLIPQWFYLDEKAFLLMGWPGYRTRRGRTGYDPLETEFEFAHMQGFIFSRLIVLRFRTKNPLSLLLMTSVGIIYCYPLLALINILLGDWSFIVILIAYCPYWIVGILLLTNVFLSIGDEILETDDENNRVFY